MTSPAFASFNLVVDDERVGPAEVACGRGSDAASGSRRPLLHRHRRRRLLCMYVHGVILNWTVVTK